MKKDCKTIKQIMVDHLSGELTAGDAETAGAVAAMDSHITTCRQCSREYKVLLALHREGAETRTAAETSMASIDWEDNALDISHNIRFKESRRKRSFALPSFSFQPAMLKLAVPTLAAVFILGLSLGYLLFYRAPSPSAPPEIVPGEETTLARLETTLAKKEMQGYLQQTQLLCTDLMRQCNDDGEGWATPVNRKRVRTLLNKNRYFARELDHPQLLSTRPLMKKIEWLLYEMIALDEDVSCEKMEQLQEFIKRERLMMKLRLVGRDISFDEV